MTSEKVPFAAGDLVVYPTHGVGKIVGIETQEIAGHTLNVFVVHFDKDWSKISEVEEYRLDWSGRRYVVHAVHRRALILDEPLRLTVAFEDLQLQ